MLDSQNYYFVPDDLVGKTYTGAFPNNKQKVNRGAQEQFLMKEAHAPIISMEVFEQVQEEMERRSNIELVDGKAKRKSTHYSTKDTERIRRDE